METAFRRTFETSECLKSESAGLPCGVKSITSHQDAEIIRGGPPVRIKYREQLRCGKEYAAWQIEWREGGRQRCTSRARKVEAQTLAQEILLDPPQIGFLTISNALQWRLQYRRVIEKAGSVEGITRIL